ELLAGTTQQLAVGGLAECLAQADTDQTSQLRRVHFRMIDPEPQDGVVATARLLLPPRQRIPRPAQHLRPPTAQEDSLGLGGVEIGSGAPVRRWRAAPPVGLQSPLLLNSLSSPVVDGQVPQRPFEQVAKAATRGIG